MHGIVRKDTGGHSSCEVNQHHTAHGDHDREFNTGDIGQAQSDGVGTKTRQPHQNDGKGGTEHEGVKAVGRGVSHPHRTDESDHEEQQQHHGPVVNVTNQQVVFGTYIGALRSLFLALNPFQQVRIELFQRYRRGSVAACG